MCSRSSSPLLLAAVLFLRGKTPALVSPLLAVVAVFAGRQPTLALNTIQFHSPFRQIDFGSVNQWLRFFSRHIPKNVAMLWRINSPPKTLFWSVFWHRNLYCRPICPLVCVGMFFIRLNRFVICAFSWFELLYDDEHDTLGRGGHYLPLLVVLVAVAVLPVTWAAENLLQQDEPSLLWQSRSVCAACVGYPSRRFPTSVSRCVWHPDGLESVAGLGRSPFPHSTESFAVVDGAKAFS